jgi:hypothetical protein
MPTVLKKNDYEIDDRQNLIARLLASFAFVLTITALIVLPTLPH